MRAVAKRCSPLAELSDLEARRLMIRVQDDDPDAFRELEQRLGCTVRKRLVRCVGNHHDAEDLAQDVFLNLHRYRKKYTPCARFSTWLWRIIQNVSRNAFRRARTHPFSFGRYHLALADLDPAVEMKMQRRYPSSLKALEFTEDTAMRCMKAVTSLLNGIPVDRKAGSAREFLRCIARIMYAAIPVNPPILCACFWNTVVHDPCSLNALVTPKELERFVTGADALTAMSRTGNARHDLQACGLIPPRPKAWAMFSTALILEGSAAFSDIQVSLTKKQVTLRLSPAVYLMLFQLIRKCVETAGYEAKRIDSCIQESFVRPTDEWIARQRSTASRNVLVGLDDADRLTFATE